MLTFSVEKIPYSLLSPKPDFYLILRIQGPLGRPFRYSFSSVYALRVELERILANKPASEHSNAWETLTHAAHLFCPASLSC